MSSSKSYSLSSKALLTGALVGGALALSVRAYFKSRDSTTVKASVSKKSTGKPAVVVIDPFSTGGVVAHEVLSRNLDCICLYSRKFPKSITDLPPAKGCRTDFAATLNHDPSQPEKTVKALAKLPFDIIGVMPGSELGVELADWLSEKVKVATNGTLLTECRRNKFKMGEQVRKSGTRAVKQCHSDSWKEIEVFAKAFPKPFKCVIKPVSSAGTDDVYCCTSVKDLEDKFKVITGKNNALGIANLSVLVQEFLEGPEYIVDTISMNGQHKLCAVWKYDRRKVNGAGFVLFGQVLVQDAKLINTLFEYQKKVLTALGFKNGAGHGEVIMTPTGPCLVEVGARPQGAEGMWCDLATQCVGYNQVDMMLDSYLDSKAFARYPERPRKYLAHSQMVQLINYTDGTLKAYNQDLVKQVEELPSFVEFHCLSAVGKKVKKTVDCFTWIGSATLCHTDAAQVEKDRAFIEHACKNGLIKVE